MDALRICWTGDWNCSSSQSILAELGADVSIVAQERLAMGKIDPPPQLIVLAQSYRGQFDQGLVEQIWTHYPHPPLVNLLSSECEGDIRAKSALRGVVRVFWYQWPHLWPRIQRQWLDSGLTSWHHPRTASTADRLLDDATSPGRSQRRFNPRTSDPQGRRVVAVLGPVADATDALCDAISVAGFLPIRYSDPRGADPLNTAGAKSNAGRSCPQSAGAPPPPPPDSVTATAPAVVCIDATTVDQCLRDRLARARRWFPGIPTLVTMGFPRPQDHRRLRELGVSAIVAKPFSIAALATTMSNFADASNRLLAEHQCRPHDAQVTIPSNSESARLPIG